MLMSNIWKRQHESGQNEHGFWNILKGLKESMTLETLEV